MSLCHGGLSVLCQARFWVQVMRDLRDGVKLKKVQERQYNPLPIEYQLTPYEMLMDDIRSKRYKLRKVMVSECRSDGLPWEKSVSRFIWIREKKMPHVHASCFFHACCTACCTVAPPQRGIALKCFPWINGKVILC